MQQLLHRLIVRMQWLDGIGTIPIRLLGVGFNRITMRLSRFNFCLDWLGQKKSNRLFVLKRTSLIQVTHLLYATILTHLRF